MVTCNTYLRKLRQSVRAPEGSIRFNFGLNVYIDLIKAHPEYAEFVQFMNSKEVWRIIRARINTADDTTLSPLLP